MEIQTNECKLIRSRKKIVVTKKIKEEKKKKVNVQRIDIRNDSLYEQTKKKKNIG